MEAQGKNQSVRARLAMFVTMTAFFGEGRSLRDNIRGVARYAGWILLFAVAGTLAAVAAIAIAEAFVPSTLLVLTTGEWELLAAVFYILAIILYLGERSFGHGRSAGKVMLAVPKLSSFGRRNLRGARVEQPDTAYPNTLEVAEA